jgi:hypothetical protein
MEGSIDAMGMRRTLSQVYVLRSAGERICWLRVTWLVLASCCWDVKPVGDWRVYWWIAEDECELSKELLEGDEERFERFDC